MRKLLFTICGVVLLATAGVFAQQEMKSGGGRFFVSRTGDIIVKARSDKSIALQSNTAITGTATISGVVTGGGFSIGSAEIVEAELEQLDTITPGTAAVNKAVVLTTGKTIDELNITTPKFGGTAITATAAEINAGRGAGVKVYRALLTQTGTDAPVATVLENSLGGTVVWARTGAGAYTGTLASAFTVNKTWPGIQKSIIANNYSISRTSANVLTVQTRDLAGDDADDILSDTPVEVIVYP